MKAFHRLTLLAATTFLTHQSFLLTPDPPLSQIMRGEYEDKIRRYSPPEKRFFVFATKDSNGVFLMSKVDLLKTVCVYNYSIENEQDLSNFNPKNIFKFLGSEDKFEIYDYFIFERYLQFQKSKLAQFLSRKGEKAFTKELFKELMRDEVCSNYDEQIKEALIFESRQFKPSKAKFLQTIDKQANSIFQDKAEYTYEQFINFKSSIVKELYEFEFARYQKIEGAIDGVDFARSILKYLYESKRKEYLHRIKQFKNIDQFKITKNQYLGFHYYLLMNGNEIQKQLNNKGAISREDLKTLINSNVISDCQVNDGQVEVLMQLLDTDKSGFIEKREFFGVLENIQKYQPANAVDSTFGELLQSKWATYKTKFYQIQEIINAD